MAVHIIAIFNNIQTLKFEPEPKVMYFATVNLLSSFCVSICQGSLAVAVIVIDGTSKM